MMLRRHGARRATAVGALFVVLTAVQGLSVVASADPNATIEASFTDSCRDFQAHSTKDISHVEIHYADGRVVKDESIDSPDYSLDGGPGDEISSAIVKSGQTSEQFDCRAGSPPTALLEGRNAYTGEWRSDDADISSCQSYGDPGCWNVDVLGDPGGDNSCDFVSALFRGTNSTDPDNDIVSWSIDFGDGTSTGVTSWADVPPSSVEHAYQQHGEHTVVLTVTDSEGHSSSDPLRVDVASCTPQD